MSKATFNPTKFNQSGNTPFASILEKRISRRDVMVRGGSGMAALGLMGSFGLTGCSGDNNGETQSFAEALNFSPIPGSKTDAVAVADGYTAQVVAPWGTPLNRMANEWQDDGSNTSIDQENAVGMHHDGMHFFPIEGSSTDGLLVMNHEYIDRLALHSDAEISANGTTSRTDSPISAEYVRKQINAHGVSVVRVKLEGDQWVVVEGDEHNRRFTGASEMDLSGPLSGSAVTPYSLDGTKARGTLNNCGNGYTPWGTYLTCEENWPGYFYVEDGKASDDQARIGLSSGAWYNWYVMAGDATEVNGEFTRFNVTPTGASETEDYRNEANGHGYIVEIDPYNPNSTPVKRTAMGRFRHEGVAYGKLVEGQPISFYSGHDARFEYIYKFVSDALWDPADANSSDRLATGAKYMDEGTLYVARFDVEGDGAWLPLTMDSPTLDGQTLGDHFDSLAAIILNTAGAADLVGATPMDRPEWTAVDPVTGTVYLTLTNNTRRTEETNAANPRLNNSFGHIVRWDDDEEGNTFVWDIFVYGSAEKEVVKDAEGNITGFGAAIDADVNRSGLTDMTQFASPDGLVFDGRGIMWIQTDNGAEEVTAYTNDQMIAVIPSQLKTEGDDYETITAANQAELKRFFVGPNGCEVTGLAYTPDYTSFFVNIQHPGNWPYSSDAAQETPDGVSVRPRSTTVVIRKADGGTIGA